MSAPIKAPMAPLLHLNGSSAEHLAHANEEAANALFLALDGLAAAAPNARDYYPKGEEAYPAALAEHRARVQKVFEAYTEICAICSAVTDQINARNAQKSKP
jgi:hypothetical protein